MKKYRKIIAVCAVFVPCHYITLAGRVASVKDDSHNSDLWTNGMSDGFRNPNDSFDDLRAHNHSVNGDNLDWHSKPCAEHLHNHCRMCGVHNPRMQQVAYSCACKNREFDSQG